MGQESEPINLLRSQRDEYKSNYERLLEKDRKRTLKDLGVADESHDSVMALLGEADAEVWDDPSQVAETIKGKGLGALIGGAGSQAQGEQPKPGASDSEQRLQSLRDNSTPPPSSDQRPSLLEQAQAALADGNTDQALALKAQFLLRQHEDGQ